MSEASAEPAISAWDLVQYVLYVVGEQALTYKPSGARVLRGLLRVRPLRADFSSRKILYPSHTVQYLY